MQKPKSSMFAGMKKEEKIQSGEMKTGRWKLGEGSRMREAGCCKTWIGSIFPTLEVMGLFIFLIIASIASAQTGYQPNDVANPKPGLYAFTHANIVVDYQTVYRNATLVIENGKILAVGEIVIVPTDASVTDLSGRWVYPSFIDIYSAYGMPEQPKRESHGNQFNSTKRGPYSWNEAIRPETDAAGIFHTNEKEAEALRNLGFGIVLSHNMDGIARGTGALVSLATGRDNKMLLRSKVSQHFSFNRGSSPQDYPRSLMGSIALLRQTFYDARWYAQATTKETDLSIEALLSAKTLPAFFEANDKWNILRAAKVGTEFGQKFIIKGGGDEYQRLDEIKKTGMPVVLPLNFPAPFDLTDSMMSRYINLTQLMHWEQAPSNPARVAAANIPFALSAFGLESKADFYKKLTKAWHYGLGTKDMLKALTTTPAQWLGMDKQYGALKAGMAANFFISTDSLMGEEFIISENWLMGEKYLNTEKLKVDLTNLNGVYEGREFYESDKKGWGFIAIISGAPQKPMIRLGNKSEPIIFNKKLSIGSGEVYKADTSSIGEITFSSKKEAYGDWSGKYKKLRDLKPSDTLPNPDLKDLNGVYKIDNHPKWTVSISGATKQLKAIYNTGNVMGDASPQFFKDSLLLVLQETDNDPWSVRDITYKIDTLADKSIQMKGLTKIRNLNGKDVAIQIRWEYGSWPKKPFVEYGESWREKPYDKITLITNATIWSNENEYGVWKTNLVIQNGKIKDIGDNLSLKYPNAKIIDATGLHLTPGIIDEHSHIACTGDVNEGTQSVTSEVRIADIINPEDINIYRQLSGGVTTSHILHGSANAIGGQTQLIKLRWGKSAEGMKFEGWEGFIKFALGENVKQSNWGDKSNVRYPQTRMGVEQTMLDAFVRAKEYQKAWKNYNELKTKNQKLQTPRRDLELDALVEILENRRHITCHSYVQSEINMLMHLADSMGFKVNTFTHILEGYKVADKMKAHGAAGSTFADWWAYKYEVMEAIPYNAFIMNKMGINTCVNSDDAEMARRLNQEAAKSIKYGGMSDTDAIKMCTINPAKMLHIDKQTGSIKVGKDADIVIWNGSPLSIYSKVLMTFVDGQLLYDASQQEYLQQQMKADRNRILKQMREAIKNGEKPVTAETPKKEEYGCGH